MLLRKFVVSVGSSLWFVPVMCVLAGAAISFGTITLDRAFDYQAIPQVLVGRPTSANAILTTIAVSMVSLTTLVLTITMVVVQLAMGQFSPRIVQRILRDKPSQLAIGLFVATFCDRTRRQDRVVDAGIPPADEPHQAVGCAGRPVHDILRQLAHPVVAFSRSQIPLVKSLGGLTSVSDALSRCRGTHCRADEHD